VIDLGTLSVGMFALGVLVLLLAGTVVAALIDRRTHSGAGDSRQ
jgi:hypothetical protein